MTNEIMARGLRQFKHRLKDDGEVYSGYMYQQEYEALDMAIKALEKTSHLIDRPCEACEFHKENGCCKWSCVFEEIKADADSDCMD